VARFKRDIEMLLAPSAERLVVIRSISVQPRIWSRSTRFNVVYVRFVSGGFWTTLGGNRLVALLSKGPKNTMSNNAHIWPIA
jgi:hypothetical protein